MLQIVNHNSEMKAFVALSAGLVLCRGQTAANALEGCKNLGGGDPLLAFIN